MGSVRFALNSNPNYRIENNAPYALQANNATNYFNWTPAEGDYTLTATPFSEAQAQGEEGKAASIDFHVHYGAKVLRFLLFNADTDELIKPLEDGDVLDVSVLGPNFSIVAETMPPEVGKLEFALHDQDPYRTELNAPYAPRGNLGTDYFPWTPALGNYTVKATPFGWPTQMGEPLSLSFDIVDRGSDELSQVSIFPNASDNWVNLRSAQPAPQTTITVVNQQGRVVYSQELAVFSELRIPVNDWNPGLYLCRIASPTREEIRRILIKETCAPSLIQLSPSLLCWV